MTKPASVAIAPIIGSRSASRSAPPEAPPISRWRLWWFTGYARRYVARHFHAVRVAGQPPLTTGPLVVYLNHPGWWDPLICLILARHFFPHRRHYAPMEAAQLERYRIFRKLGFFPVEKNTRRGAAQFLRGAEAVLAQPGAVLWVTAQGRFADVRERPLRLEAGVTHLARRLSGVEFVPLALEYPFWGERCPEALARWGEPVRDSAELEAALERTQDALAGASLRRAAGEFQIVLHGSAGVGGFYDQWRRLQARWRGEAFKREHEG